MERILAEIREAYFATDFAKELAAGTSLDKSTEIFELSLTCLLLGVSKQLTHAIGKQVIIYKLLKTRLPELETEPADEAVCDLVFNGDKLLASMLPGQKSLFVKVVVSHFRMRAEAASVLFSIVTNFLVKYVRKEAFSARWTEQELIFNLHELTILSSLSALTDHDIRGLGVTSLLRKA